MDWFLYDNGLRHERVKQFINYSPNRTKKLLKVCFVRIEYDDKYSELRQNRLQEDFSQNIFLITFPAKITCSNSTIETLVKGVKYVQS